uniref:Uncharacterized protein n=1 Tax=Araneus ventricosus TaxID=182803 RepID=A0A4Y2LED5_ARAVE|nr:hypothetical protein AVEN_236313-1 [Araneus ventricosus]
MRRAHWSCTVFFVGTWNHVHSGRSSKTNQKQIARNVIATGTFVRCAEITGVVQFASSAHGITYILEDPQRRI